MPNAKERRQEKRHPDSDESPKQKKEHKERVLKYNGNIASKKKDGTIIYRCQCSKCGKNCYTSVDRNKEKGWMCLKCRPPKPKKEPAPKKSKKANKQKSKETEDGEEEAEDGEEEAPTFR